MRLGIMQPYFFPYIGYFSLIAHCDRFILLDSVQFIRHGWIERNRILKPREGWQYIRVPLVRHPRETAIKDVRIDAKADWRRRLIAQLGHYRTRAPHYSQVVDWLESALDVDTESIVTLNRHLLRAACDRLAIGTPIEVFSQMGMAIEQPSAPDEWALKICKAVGGVTEYWNPPGGKGLFDRAKYENHGIKLSFLAPRLTVYGQGRACSEAGLSIVDVMMFNDAAAIHGMLNDYELL